MPTVALPSGPIDYRVFGPDGADVPVAVCVHGFLVNGTLWDPVAERLADSGVRTIVPDWPLGAHRTPVPTELELTPGSVARAVLELLDELDLKNVVLVGNDSGGALCQLALAGPARPGRGARAHELRRLRGVPAEVLPAALPGRPVPVRRVDHRADHPATVAPSFTSRLRPAAASTSSHGPDARMDATPAAGLGHPTRHHPLRPRPEGGRAHELG